jgi:hypothetical protein
MVSLQSSQLAEAAEILDILNQIELEGLFYSHDKLAQLQVILTSSRDPGYSQPN